MQFNQYRDEQYENYMNEKAAQKNEGTSKERGEFTKLYKALGSDNRNKDVRRQLQGEVNMYTDNQLSVSLNTNHFPGYTMDKHN